MNGEDAAATQHASAAQTIVPFIRIKHDGPMACIDLGLVDEPNCVKHRFEYDGIIYVGGSVMEVCAQRPVAHKALTASPIFSHFSSPTLGMRIPVRILHS